ncbi:MAG: peptidoglycan bridge formation glycyltransferase FemA/FemB family protein [Candidatus Kerfeldbacteria bacterium]
MSSCDIRRAEDSEGWDEFVLRCTKPNEFLQSWQWGVFQRAAGKYTERIEVLLDGKRAAVALLVQHTTRLLRTFILVPRGPIIDPALPADRQHEVWKAFINHVDSVRTPDTMFLKIEPNLIPPQDVGFSEGSGVHPERTLLIDLTKNEQTLLSDMHQKTRYNIKLAERHGVTVGFSRSPTDVEEFLALLKETAQRQKIGIFPLPYYRTMVESLGDSIEVAVARMHTTPVAAGLMVRFGSTLTYLHGASSAEHHQHMAPHLLQWESIVRAKGLGCSVYDFFGIAPEGTVDHRWNGITRFKMGFGGTVHQYAGAFNLVYQRAWYLAYRLAKRAAGR